MSREDLMVVIKRNEVGEPVVWCDPEIVNLVQALNGAGIGTVASCSGHGGPFGNIALTDGRELLIMPNYESARAAENAILAATTVPTVDAGSVTAWIKCKDQQPMIPGWYDAWWSGSSSPKESRSYWNGYTWLDENYHPTSFGVTPHQYPCDAWRGLSENPGTPKEA